ncbi:MAG: hypothetical protein IJJ04_02340 [Clostridia bacterium]|nr:hypothetical protein [Clostridia bacterium]
MNTNVKALSMEELENISGGSVESVNVEAVIDKIVVIGTAVIVVVKVGKILYNIYKGDIDVSKGLDEVFKNIKSLVKKIGL